MSLFTMIVWIRKTGPDLLVKILKAVTFGCLGVAGKAHPILLKLAS